jgi:hypothetical protein
MHSRNFVGRQAPGSTGIGAIGLQMQCNRIPSFRDAHSVIPGRRAAANPESRPYHCEIPGLRLRALGMTRCNGPR